MADSRSPQSSAGAPPPGSRARTLGRPRGRAPSPGRRASLLLLACAALAAPAASRAQPPSPAPLDDRPALRVPEVERGLSIGADLGGVVLFGPGARSGSGTSFGRSVGLSLNADLGERLGLGLWLLGAHLDTPADFVGREGRRGDFSALAAGALVRGAIWSAADPFGVRRTYLWLRAGAGVASLSPDGFFARPDLLLFAGTSLEYFARLRHFSVGVDADLVFGPRALGPGLKLAPFLRYTF